MKEVIYYLKMYLSGVVFNLALFGLVDFYDNKEIIFKDIKIWLLSSLSWILVSISICGFYRGINKNKKNIDQYLEKKERGLNERN